MQCIILQTLIFRHTEILDYYVAQSIFSAIRSAVMLLYFLQFDLNFIVSNIHSLILFSSFSHPFQHICNKRAVIRNSDFKRKSVRSSINARDVHKI